MTVCGRRQRTVWALLLALLPDGGGVVAVVGTPAAPGRGGLVAGLQPRVDPLEEGVAEEARQRQGEQGKAAPAQPPVNTRELVSKS